GCTSLLKMHIREKEGSEPVASKPYPVNKEQRDQVRKIVAEWKAQGIVRESISPYASPVLLLKKKNGEHRLVIDYRRLNAQTVRDPYPIPTIEDQLEFLKEAKLFTTLDLAQGYLQVPLDEASCHKTAFITPDETAEFTRMIFGLTNGPAVFQRLMQQVLGPLRHSIATD